MAAAAAREARESEAGGGSGIALPAPRVGVGDRDGGMGVRWLIGFIVLQFLCQMALLVPQLASVRIAFRTASFGASLAMLVVAANRRGRTHPAFGAALCVLVVLLFQLMHPQSPGILSSLATIGLNLAIMAPIVWVARLRLDGRALRLVVLTLWGFQTASALVGLAQIQYPEKFQMAISSVAQNSPFGIEGARFRLADGTEVLRPTGLTDQPGGAAAAGMIVIVFGFGLAVYERNLWLKSLALLSMLIGPPVILFCQVRMAWVMAAICLTVFCTMVILRGDGRRLIWPLIICTIAAAIGVTWALAVGGEAIQGRVLSLFQDSPGEVYYNNRGVFLHYTVVVLLPEYPMGAGMGRWGMIQYYFAPDANPLWAEIQWTGWLFDGGVPMILAYTAAIAIAMWVSLRIALDRRTGDFGILATLIFAYNVAALAVTFSYPLFNGQGGMEFWMLNTCLYVAYRSIQSPAGAVAVPVPVQPWVSVSSIAEARR
jgi:hypothetical protein